MITATCHCGTVSIEIDRPPETVNNCHCTHCHKRGVLWAYYAPAQVRLPAPDATTVYMCNDRVIETHFCRTCGCTTHWVDVDKTYDRMAVNARLMDPKILATARITENSGP